MLILLTVLTYLIYDVSFFLPHVRNVGLVGSCEKLMRQVYGTEAAGSTCPVLADHSYGLEVNNYSRNEYYSN